MAEQLKQFLVHCEGGLDLTQNILMHTPGSATILKNYEAGLTGGYRRLSGFLKYSTTAVTGQGSVLGIFVYSAGVVAVRPTVADVTKADVYYGTGTTWAKINTDVRLTPSKVQFVRYNWTGTERFCMVDGVNNAAKYDGTTWTILNGAGAPVDPSIVTEHKGFIVVSGYSSNRGAISISTVLDETNWGAGAKEIVVGDTVVALHSWRDNLYIFCKRSIYEMTGSTNSDFAIKPVSKNIGCVAQFSVREVNGDLYFLAADGVRSIAGTAKIDDFELGSVSHPINTLISGISSDTYNISSCVVRAKNQYRLFYVASTDTDLSAKGIVGFIRGAINDISQTRGWEWGELLGIRPYCADSSYVAAQELVVHGGFDGFVYRQEQGTAFGSNPITCVYSTVNFPLDDGDTGLRKNIQRIILYVTAEGTSSVGMQLYYDQNDPTKGQPATYTLTGLGGTIYVFDATSVVFDSTPVFDQQGFPIFRQPVSGSGMMVSLQFSDSSSTNASHTILGFAIEYLIHGRR